jgi:hypothetical protein
VQWWRVKAVHEAGHAVVGLRFGFPLELIAISREPADDSEGRVQWRVPFPAVYRHYALMAVAGERAAMALLDREIGYTPRRGWVLEVGSRLDRATLVSVCQDHGQTLTFGSTEPTTSGPQMDWAELSDEADALLASKWHQVDALATALQVDNQIDGKATVTLLAAADIQAALNAATPSHSLRQSSPAAARAAVVWGHRANPHRAPASLSWNGRAGHPARPVPNQTALSVHVTVPATPGLSLRWPWRQPPTGFTTPPAGGAR